MSEDATTTPVRRAQFSARRTDEIVDFLARRYVEVRPPAGSRVQTAFFSSSSAATDNLSAARLRVSMNLDLATDPFDEPIPVMVLGGRVRVQAGGQDLRISAGECFLQRPGVPAVVSRWDFDGSVVQVPLDEIARVAGVEAGGLRFESARPATPALGRYWRGVVALAVRELLDPESPVDNPVVAGQLRHLVASALLAVFPNTTMTTDPLRGPGYVAPATVRRATAFMEANCGRPITLADIAAAAGTGPRAVQHAFARHHGTSPTAYLRRLRLERAHQELRTADPTQGHTVASIARRWGFSNPGRFAAEYRLVYAESPSQTLRS